MVIAAWTYYYNYFDRKYYFDYNAAILDLDGAVLMIYVGNSYYSIVYDVYMQPIFQH